MTQKEKMYDSKAMQCNDSTLPCLANDKMDFESAKDAQANMPAASATPMTWRKTESGWNSFPVDNNSGDLKGLKMVFKKNGNGEWTIKGRDVTPPTSDDEESDVLSSLRNVNIKDTSVNNEEFLPLNGAISPPYATSAVNGFRDGKKAEAIQRMVFHSAYKYALVKFVNEEELQYVPLEVCRSFAPQLVARFCLQKQNNGETPGQKPVTKAKAKRLAHPA
jgi:hypothetical protein